MQRLSVESIARAEKAMQSSAAKWVAAASEKRMELPARSLLRPIETETQLPGVRGNHSPGDKVVLQIFPS